MSESVQFHSAALDIPTIFIVAVSLAALLGLFLIFAWLQERDTRALAWWGAAYLIGASAIAIWNAPVPLLPVPLSGALIFVACGMVWNGIRLFQGRRVLPIPIFGGALIWLAVQHFPGMVGDASRHAILGALLVAGYTFCIAFELWRERRKSLISRTAAVVVPLMHAAMFVAPLALNKYISHGRGDGWLGVFALETMIYAVGTAFIVLLMVKDHHVRIQRDAASIDPLTGLLNRRAFFTNIAALYQRQRKANAPVTLLMFDLDHFKSINDRFGHATGDDVLRLFAATLRSSMRASDIIGRLGGEEMAAVVPGRLDLAEKIAERIRASFEIAGLTVGGIDIGATVSIGVACDAALTHPVEDLMAIADAALYRAKHGGRNRISAAGEIDAARPVARPSPPMAPAAAPVGLPAVP